MTCVRSAVMTLYRLCEKCCDGMRVKCCDVMLVKCCAGAGETALMLHLALSRRLLVADRRCRAGDWGFKKMATTPAGGCQLAYNGSTVIMGLGAVGQHVARCLVAMGTRVCATRWSLKQVEKRDGVEVHPAASLGTLLAQASAVVITAPLTPATRGMMNATLLAQCPDGCNIVNVGRAEIVCEDAIWAEVSTGRLGYAADVRISLLCHHQTD